MPAETVKSQGPIFHPASAAAAGIGMSFDNPNPLESLQMSSSRFPDLVTV